MAGFGGFLGEGVRGSFWGVFGSFYGFLWDFVGVVGGGGGGWWKIIHNIFYHSGVSWKWLGGCYLKT